MTSRAVPPPERARIAGSAVGVAIRPVRVGAAASVERRTGAKDAGQWVTTVVEQDQFGRSSPIGECALRDRFRIPGPAARYVHHEAVRCARVSSGLVLASLCSSRKISSIFMSNSLAIRKAMLRHLPLSSVVRVIVLEHSAVARQAIQGSR
jgi:hypothetical protein